MIEGNIKYHEHVVHKKTGDKYRILGTGNMKSAPPNPTTPLQDWTPSVVYFRDSNPTELFTRDEWHFRQSFERTA